MFVLLGKSKKEVYIYIHKSGKMESRKIGIIITNEFRLKEEKKSKTFFFTWKQSLQ